MTKRKTRHNLTAETAKKRSQLESDASMAEASEKVALPKVVRVTVAIISAMLAPVIAVFVYQIAANTATLTVVQLVESSAVSSEDASMMLSAAWGGAGAGALLLIPKLYNAFKNGFVKCVEGIQYLSKRVQTRTSKQTDKQSFSALKEKFSRKACDDSNNASEVS